MRGRTKRLLVMTAALVAACVGFTLWHGLWGGLRVTVINRTPERHDFLVTYRGNRLKVDLASGESRAMRLQAVAPCPRGTTSTRR